MAEKSENLRPHLSAAHCFLVLNLRFTLQLLIVVIMDDFVRVCTVIEPD